jgi:MFS family permease
VNRRLALALGWVQMLAWATTYYIPAIMAAPAAAEFGVSRTLLLGGFSWALLIAGFIAPRVGRHIDRAGGRGVLGWGTCISIVGLAALAAAPGVVFWYLAWSVLGVAMAMTLYDAAFATIGRLLGAASRPTIIGVTLLGGFASTLAWPGGTFLQAHIGWRAAVALFAGLQLCAILPVVLAFIPSVPPSTGVAAESGRPSATISRSERRAFVLIAIYFTSRAAITAVVAVHVLPLLAGLGLSTERSAFVAALIGPAQVASRLLDWRFARGLTPFAAAIIGAALLPASIAVLLAGVSAVVFAVAYGMSNGLLTISRGTLPMHVFGSAGYASLIGRLAMPSLLAQAAAPTLIAPAIDALPAAWTLGGIGVVGAAGLGCLLAIRPAGVRA